MLSSTKCTRFPNNSTNELSVTYEEVLTLVQMLHLSGSLLVNWLHASHYQTDHNSETE